ncbi:MAG TPA: 16S rRNA (guanine(966)-N(2))-methyltransferase RsmD [Planktothrix sp.]|jgi:16S rRNA (guanine(966)-N(2))-methyltransferase RsmD
MIITGGEARGRRIASPEGLSVRPTSSKIRQALFNILGARVVGANFLDIFAGSGLMGLEALSRGAESLTSIEESRKLVDAIATNMRSIGYQASLMTGDFRRILPRLPLDSFDIIFADPPYKSPFASTVTRTIDGHCILKPDGRLVIEHVRDYVFPKDLQLIERIDTRDYGQTGISFFQRRDAH